MSVAFNYQHKVISIQEALAKIKSNDSVVSALAGAEAKGCLLYTSRCV